MRGANMKLMVWLLSITQVITLAWLLVLTGRTGVQWYSAEWLACVDESSRNRDVYADMDWQRKCTPHRSLRAQIALNRHQVDGIMRYLQGRHEQE